MREIKFRCFDIENKIMFTDCKQVLDALKSYILFPECHEKLVFMQFTGMLDEVGKAIYEGDIIKVGEIGQYELIYKTGRLLARASPEFSKQYSLSPYHNYMLLSR